MPHPPDRATLAALLAACALAGPPAARAESWQSYGSTGIFRNEVDTDSVRVEQGLVFFRYRQVDTYNGDEPNPRRIDGVVDCAQRRHADVEHGRYELLAIYPGTGMAKQADLVCAIAGSRVVAVATPGSPWPPPRPLVPAPIPQAPAGGHAPRMLAYDAACKPQYPDAARRTQAQGITRVRIHVDEAGRGVSAQVLGGAGDNPGQALLDEAARSALVRCPFEPGTDAVGRPAAGDVSVEYHWRLP